MAEDLTKLSDDELLDLEKLYRKQSTQYHLKQYSRKIKLNSSYGATGSAYFRYFDARLASAVSVSGQLAIRWVQKVLNEYFNNMMNTQGEKYVVYVDTDSNYICMDNLVRHVFPNGAETKKIAEFLDKIFKEDVLPVIEKAYAEMAEYVNAYENHMSMDREIIADRVLWTKKKRYICNVLNSEGVPYDPPKLKIMGIESVRSSTPQMCRGAIKESVRMILQEDENAVQTHISNFKDQFMKAPVEDIAFPRSMNGLAKYDPNLNPEGLKFDKTGKYLSHTPIQVRGALLHNRLVDEMDISDTRPLIREGEKIKFCYLKMPNPIHEDVVSFPTYLPSEFDIGEYVDRETQFEKTFLSPVERLLDVIGWNAEETVTLEDFF